MYGRLFGTTGTGAAGATLAATGYGLNSLALIVAGTTLIAAGLSLWKLLPKLRRNR